MDYKTGKSRKDADARRDLQLSIYAIAAKEILELNPVRLVFHYLQNNQTQVTTRNAKQLDEAQKSVQEAAADIRAGEFSPKPGYACRTCAYEAICPAHEEAGFGLRRAAERKARSRNLTQRSRRPEHRGRGDIIPVPAALLAEGQGKADWPNEKRKDGRKGRCG